MLTQETKRKIDSARNILVGKVPDPKAQVEQITTALIYKFMDDMDKEAIELGGKARFFTKGFEKYAWTKLLDQKLGGHERLELYGEAVAKMSQNPHIPQLFRDIFKDAFLPYRSPETLTLFLKEINGFTYDHSEDLGNAFEYLLSILGSQGDAGQFRTPRHIIDFIAEVVDPKKGDKILDPACGTAGFLISAYKHILKQQKDKPLTPDEKEKLMNNLVGYDISPDMVKLSKVNMYLHGFAEPKIFEYDTLSSDEKWDEMYDVIMANPPFMTPTGGIKPHKRFSVQANKAEVLFVDYMLEHLGINGRGGVIVPEGVVFNTQSSFRSLRTKLVKDNWLWAVISLPSGVFNPYADNKTNILFFDKEISKKSDSVYFIDIQNDGYDLGLQRKEFEKNDLPLCVELLDEIKKSILGSYKLAHKTNLVFHIVKKESILLSKQSKLLANEYLKNHNAENDDFVKLSKVLSFYNEKPISLVDEKEYKVLGVRSHGKGCFISKVVKGKELKKTLKYRPVKNDSLFWCKVDTKSGGFGLITKDYSDCVVTSNMATAKLNTDLILPKFLNLVISSGDFESIVANASSGSTNRKYLTPPDLLEKIYIPLPSISEQIKIVKKYDEVEKLRNNLNKEDVLLRNTILDLWR